MKIKIGLCCLILLLISGCSRADADVNGTDAVTSATVNASEHSSLENGVLPSETPGDILATETAGDIPAIEGTSSQYILPEPNTSGHMSVEEAIKNRRSRRNYVDNAISAEQLSQILWAAYGITDGGGRRSAPSAGAVYTLEVYVSVGNVTGIVPGPYKYDPWEHKIVRTADGDIREELSFSAEMIGTAAITIVYAADFERVTEAFGEHGLEKYVYMEAGHSAQNVYLQAEALGLGACVMGAFFGHEVHRVMGLPEEEQPIYLMTVGYVNN